MSDKPAKPLQVMLRGMDDRTYRTMVMYFQGPCKGQAIAVEEEDAEADIVDTDMVTGKNALAKLKAQKSPRPIIVLSKEAITDTTVIYVEKPIRLTTMLAAFANAKAKAEDKGLIKSAPILV
jgi:hypothetical protein